jgi:tetratricopeptide (TPR) repeat protein
MILRLSDSLSRGLIVAASFVIAAVLSFFSIRTAIAARGADQGSADGFRLATRLEPQNSEYWYRFGHFEQFNLEDSDSAEAEKLLEKAIEIDPKYSDAWLDLGTAYELDGDSAKARDAYIEAKKSYPASAEVAWRFGNFLLRQGDSQAAYPEFRRALETDPRRAAAAFSRCYRANPNLDEIIDQILPAKPGPYVDIIKEMSDSKQVAVAQVVWKRLLAMHPRLNVTDFQPLVGALLQEGDTVQARQVWAEGSAAMYLPPLGGLPDSLIWDPGFESGINQAIFSWSFQPIVQGVTAAFDTTEKHSGNQSLRLSFDGKHNPEIEPACVKVIVTPNTDYQLTGWVKTNALTTNHGIGFRVHSYTDKGEASLVASGQRVYGTTDWTPVDLTYITGPNVKTALVCVYRERDLDSDERISGTAWVDDVNLVPKVLEPSKP